MNIVVFTHKFLELEEKNNFFDYSDHTGLQFWELVRFEIFYTIYFQISNEEKKDTKLPNRLNNTDHNSLFHKVFNIFKFYTQTYFRKTKYLCFVCSRYKNEDGLNFDIACEDVIRIIKEDTLIFESYRNKARYLHKHIIDYGLSFARYMYQIQNKVRNTPKQNKYEITYILKNEFNTDIDLDNLIFNLIDNYKIENLYYLKLFKRLSPKAIFLMQNGIQKGMFAAANQLKIPLIELQHGLIGYIHPIYSYPKTINAQQLKALPKFFFSFSSFWTKDTYFPVEKILSTGNSYYAKKISKDQVIYEITFIFADIHTKELIQLIDKLLLKDFKRSICIKLHSNQYFLAEEIKNYYKPFEFISIILNEKNIESLIAVSKSILAIQSTCVYQALHNNTKVMIYTKLDYQSHADVFENPYVILVNSANDILNALNETNPVYTNKITYFDDFNIELFEGFLKECTK